MTCHEQGETNTTVTATNESCPFVICDICIPQQLSKWPGSDHKTFEEMTQVFQ